MKGNTTRGRALRKGPPPPGGTGRLSSDTSFAPPIGSQWEDPGTGTPGYYIDFSVKTDSPEWPPAWLSGLGGDIHVASVQWGLGAFERYVRGEGEQWLEGARLAAEYLLGLQERDGPQAGGWCQLVAMPHTYRLEPPWLSAITQGEAASLLARLHKETGEDRFGEAALLALRPFDVPVVEGGVLAHLDGMPFVEEYPTDPPSFVLNGAIFGLWGLRDAGMLLEDSALSEAFASLTTALAAVLDRYDTGYWSRYDLYPHAVPNLASSAYHLLHVRQLTILDRIGAGASFGEKARRFEEYRDSSLNRRRALAAKVAFRLTNPRNRVLALRMPWMDQEAARRRARRRWETGATGLGGGDQDEVPRVTGRGRSDLVALCYHAVSDEWRSNLSITPAQLESHLSHLLDRGFRPATFSEAVLGPREEKTFAVTFDDAYASVGKLAAPVLARLGVPGTVFVPTAFAGSSEPMAWPGIERAAAGDHAAELLPLSWEELAQLADSGWEVGSHTRSHPRLTEVDDATLVEELLESRLEIERRLGRPCLSIAYPYGDFDARVVQAASATGYVVACTLPPPFAEFEHVLAVSRVGVYDVDSAARFRLKTSPAMRRLRHGPAGALISMVSQLTSSREESS